MSHHGSGTGPMSTSIIAAGVRMLARPQSNRKYRVGLAGRVITGRAAGGVGRPASEVTGGRGVVVDTGGGGDVVEVVDVEVGDVTEDVVGVAPG